jgi:hypothetical protein
MYNDDNYNSNNSQPSITLVIDYLRLYFIYFPIALEKNKINVLTYCSVCTINNRYSVPK